jgi:uncharacterized protein YybS (DUF2232 family)
VECKALPSMHESKNKDKPKDYAVDGVLHYAKALSKEFEVIAIASSGESETELKILKTQTTSQKEIIPCEVVVVKKVYLTLNL